MKKILALSLFLAVKTVYSQPSSGKVNLPKLTEKQDAIILNLTSDNWTELESGMKTKPIRSRGFSFLFMNERMNKGGHIGAALGIGFSSQNVHSNSVIVYSSDKSFTFLQPIPSGTDYDLNKLSLNFLDGAFEIRFRTNENKNHHHFKVSAGIKGGLLLQSHTKFEDSEGKFKTYKIANLNKFQYGLTGRIAFGHWGISGYYSLIGIFEDGKGPELVPYSVGIAFTP